MTQEPSPISEAEIEGLERLLREATPGPWHGLHDGPDAKNPDCSCGQVWSGAVDWPVAFCDTREGDEGPNERVRKANAALIVAAINALPQLLETARKAGEYREALEAIAGGRISTDFVMSIPPDWRSAFGQLQALAKAALSKQADHGGGS